MYEDKTYASILSDAQKETGAGVQTGEGWLVGNALSALAYEAEKLYIQMDYICKQNQTQSIFASAELGYKSTYYLTLTGRTDWPSQLAGPNSVKSAFFYPSIGGSVILSEIIPLCCDRDNQ